MVRINPGDEPVFGHGSHQGHVLHAGINHLPNAPGIKKGAGLEDIRLGHGVALAHSDGKGLPGMVQIDQGSPLFQGRGNPSQGFMNFHAQDQVTIMGQGEDSAVCSMRPMSMSRSRESMRRGAEWPVSKCIEDQSAGGILEDARG